MRKLLAVVLALVVTFGGLGLWGYSQAAPKERHPLIHQALRKLREARRDLQKAARDFGGHRTAAVKDIDHAIHELEEALRYDRR